MLIVEMQLLGCMCCVDLEIDANRSCLIAVPRSGWLQRFTKVVRGELYLFEVEKFGYSNSLRDFRSGWWSTSGNLPQTCVRFFFFSTAGLRYADGEDAANLGVKTI